jgi:hypothetical protein
VRTRSSDYHTPPSATTFERSQYPFHTEVASVTMLLYFDVDIHISLSLSLLFEFSVNPCNLFFLHIWSSFFYYYFFKILNNVLNYKCFSISPLIFFSFSNLIHILFITICFILDHYLYFLYIISSFLDFFYQI